MSTAENAKIQYESGQDLVSFVALTDQGDHKDFRSADNLWSNKSGYKPVVLPNGLATGGLITPAASGTKEAVDVAALTCYIGGALVSVSADTNVLAVRPSVTSPAAPYKKDSIVVTGSSIAVVEGTAGSAFSATRGAAGGPPLIPLASVEIGQVWMSSTTSAVIASTEIKQVPGTHQELYNFPIWTQKRFRVTNGIIGYAGVEFASALPLIHSAASPVVAVPKAVYAQYYEPSFSDIPKSSDFVAPEKTYSVSSKQIYAQTLGSSSSSLGQGSFTAYLEDGISDGLLREEGSNLFFKFFQDEDNATPYRLCQGILGMSVSYPPGDQITAACTISAEEAAVNVTG